MRSRQLDTLFYACAHLCLLSCVLQSARCQRDSSPLRRTIQWQHDGRLFSILSQGAQYVPPLRRNGNGDGEQQQEQRQQPSPVRPLTVISSDNERHNDPTGSSSVPSHSHGSRWLPIRRAGAPRGRVNGTARTAPGQLPSASPSPPPPRAREDSMVGDDPYNPYKYSEQDNPYYNYYDAYERPSPRQRPGYGTRYFQYGKDSRWYRVLHFHDIDENVYSF